ncbi:unnamed protein product [Effrenium voratum]|uniref:Polynucleotide adenylyltransferase n=1 Tax=Effrenium voratum TaxID=2562239 RepID=A0AA36JNM6_9DINO|nr:unnamed protein product [Effrenium voratum]
MAITQNLPPLFLQGTDCRFCGDLPQIHLHLAELQKSCGPNEAGALAEESLGELLLEFFRYFGYVYETGVIAIRDISSFTPRFEPGQSFYVVDNPFEPTKDVANIEVRLYTCLREEFRRAHAILCEGLGFAELCSSPPRLGLDPLAGAIVPGMNVPLSPPKTEISSHCRDPARSAVSEKSP